MNCFLSREFSISAFQLCRLELSKCHLGVPTNASLIFSEMLRGQLKIIQVEFNWLILIRETRWADEKVSSILDKNAEDRFTLVERLKDVLRAYKHQKPGV